MTAPIIEINNLSFAYPGNTVPVVRDVNLSIDEYESVCMIGPNGGGKTTLLKLILGLLSPSKGTITVNGYEPRISRNLIGYMPQYYNLDQDFPISALDVVLMGRLHEKFWGRYSRKDRIAAMAALEEMSVADLAGRRFADMSGGQRQRVLIARALAGDPKVLLLDEPTANVDPGAQEKFYDILETLNKKMTLIIVSHDLGFVSNNINTVACVNKTVHVHPVSQLSGDMVSEMYGYDVSLIHHNHNCSERGHTHG
jgi:zinc transport system ATP-binding protein